MHWTAGAGSVCVRHESIIVYIDVPIPDTSWFPYTGMYTDHTVFNHYVQNIWYFVCFKGEQYITYAYVQLRFFSFHSFTFLAHLERW